MPLVHVFLHLNSTIQIILKHLVPFRTVPIPIRFHASHIKSALPVSVICSARFSTVSILVNPIFTIQFGRNHIKSMFQVFWNLASFSTVPIYAHCLAEPITDGLALYPIVTQQFSGDHVKSTFQMILRRLASFSAVHISIDPPNY